MKERPIIFSGPMVRAILEGRKTQTRRVIKPQAWSYSNDILGQQQIYACSGPDDFGDPDKPIRCPYGQLGDLLYVKENWRLIIVNGVRGGIAEFATIQFKEGFRVLDYREDWREFYRDKLDGEAPLTATTTGDMVGPWRSSRYMPKKYARLWLRITNVRVERVQEIYPWECKAEGIVKELNDVSFDLMEKFRHLWDSPDAKRGYSWESNPYVWVVEFERYDHS